MQRTEQPTMFYGAKRKVFQNAELLRKNMTPAELLLWERLKKNQLGIRFKAQHPIDTFIADFYCHKFKLVVEIDGKIHDSQIEYDQNRTAELERWGIAVIRFSNEEVINNIDCVIEKIKEYLQPLTPPQTLPQTPKGA